MNSRPNGNSEAGIPPQLEELIYLYEKLSVEERDELLQCLLIAALRGGEAMIVAEVKERAGSAGLGEELERSLEWSLGYAESVDPIPALIAPPQSNEGEA